MITVIRTVTAFPGMIVGNTMKCGPKCQAMGNIEWLLRKPATCSWRAAVSVWLLVNLQGRRSSKGAH
jgi:hypothetical protein